jgi:hypothetical protein
VHKPSGHNLFLARGASDRAGAGVVLAGFRIGVAVGSSPNSASTRAPRIGPSPGWDKMISASGC